MQYRRPVGAGPSSKTWPRWELPAVDRTSVRVIPSVSSVVDTTCPLSIGRVKLGQPVPDSNLVERAEERLAGCDVDIDAVGVVVPEFVLEWRLGRIVLGHHLELDRGQLAAGVRRPVV